MNSARTRLKVKPTGRFALGVAVFLSLLFGFVALPGQAAAQFLDEADLSLAMSDAPDPVVENAPLTYSLTVTNNGPSVATGVTVVDQLPGSVDFVSASGGCSNAAGTVTCNLGTVGFPLLNTKTVEIVVRPRQPGTILNTAEVSSGQTDPNLGNNDDFESTVVTAAVADLSITKADSPDPVREGENLTYTLTATNAGPNNATGVTVVDTLPAGVDFISAGPLAGDSASCNQSAGVVTCTNVDGNSSDTVSDLDAGATAVIQIVVRPRQMGTINNVASIVGNETDPNTANNSDSEPTTVVGVDLAITKTDSPDPIFEDNQLTYTLTISNPVNVVAGTQNATGVIAVDTLPGSVSFVSATGGCTQSAGTVTCPIGALAEGASVQRQIVVTANDPGTITNVASVSGDQSDPNTVNNSDSEDTTVSASTPDLSLTKTDSPDPVAENGQLTYTLSVTNLANGLPGGQRATGVTATDQLPASVDFVSADAGCSNALGVVTCSFGDLAEGASAQKQIRVTPRDPGLISNQASVSSNETDTNPANNSDTETTTVTAAAPDLDLDKLDSADPIAENDDLTYTLVVLNKAGADNATGVQIVDQLPATVDFVSASPGCSNNAGTVTCVVGALAAGSSAEREIVVRARQPGQIINTAEASSTEPDAIPADNNASENTTVVAAGPDLAVAKSDSPDPVTEDSNLTYTVAVSNLTNAADGIDNATGATLTDVLPAGVDFVSATVTTGSGSCNQAAGTVTCSNLDGNGAADGVTGELDEGDTATVQIVVTPRQIGTITNQASVAGNETDPIAANNSDSEDSTVVGADLSVTKTDSVDPVTEDSPLTYTLTATNQPNAHAGSQTATGVTAVDTLPASVDFQSADSGCAAVAQTVTCNFGDLAEGVSAQKQITVIPRQLGTITNAVSISGQQGDAIAANDSDSEDTTVVGADLSIVKSDDADPALLGGQVTYTLSITNEANAISGNQDATGVRAVDTLPGSVTFVSAGPGCTNAAGVVTCLIGPLAEGASVQRQIIVTTNQLGTITNQADVSGDQGDANQANNSDSEDTTVRGSAADLSISKSDSSDPVRVGDQFDYTLAVANQGPDAATGVVITDALPSQVTFVSAAPGCTESAGTVSCAVGAVPNGGQASRTITVSATQPGTVSNTASVAAGEPDPVAGNNSDTEQTTVRGRSADLSISKSDSADPVRDGDQFAYTLEVANHGPDEATGVVITDRLPAEVSFVVGSAGCTEAAGTVTCTVGSLANGGGTTRTITVRAEQAGTASNTASVAGSESDPAAANNSDTELTAIGAGDLCKGQVPTIVGTDGNDALVGTAGADVIYAGDGNDTVQGGGGDDVICLGAGGDVATGQGGNDTAIGGGGADALKGGAGDDLLKGGGGNDGLKGGAGDDRLQGGAGNDALNGGSGRDDRCAGGSGNNSGGGGCEQSTGIA